MGGIDIQVILELCLIGLATGYLAGLLGIGGGMLMTPFITFILTKRGVAPDLAVKMAIATSMATIVFTSISSVRAHHQRGGVRWDIVRHLAPGIVLGAALASLGVFALLKGAYLAMVFALFTGFSAVQMLRNKKPLPTKQLPGPAGQFGAGTVIGFVSGLVGAGGGFISVPYMLAHNVAMANAVATSAALGFPIALANAAGYVASGLLSSHALPPLSMGYIWLPALVLIASCSVMTAPLGAKAAHTLPVGTLRKIFAGLLLCLGSYMLYKGIGSL